MGGFTEANGCPFQKFCFQYLISGVPDEALPIAGDGDELIRFLGDVLFPQQLPFRVNLEVPMSAGCSRIME